MSNLLSRRSALASGAAALWGLLVAKTRAVFGSSGATRSAPAGERGDVTSLRYDDFAPPASELIDDRGCRRVAKCR